MTKEEKASQEKEWLRLVTKIADCRNKNLTWQQVAEKLGMTISSVKSHWHRRKHLLEESAQTETYKADWFEIPTTEKGTIEEGSTVKTQPVEKKTDLSRTVHEASECEVEDLSKTAAFREKFTKGGLAGMTPGDVLVEAIRIGPNTEESVVNELRNELEVLLTAEETDADHQLSEAIRMALRYYECGTLKAVAKREMPVSNTPSTIFADNCDKRRRLYRPWPGNGPGHSASEGIAGTSMECVQADTKTNEPGDEEKAPDATFHFAAEGGNKHLSHSLREMHDLVTRYRVHYMIDTENVNAPAISNLAKNLHPDELIHLFYSDNSKGLPYAVLEILLQKPNQIQLEYCICGTPNAMDFQIVTILGLMIAACDPKRSKFRIITDDRGYDAVVQYWKWKGMPVERIPSGSIQSMLERRCMSEQEIARIYAQPPKNESRKTDDNLMNLLTMTREANIKEQEDVPSDRSTVPLPAPLPEKSPQPSQTVSKKAAAGRKTDEISQMFLGLPPKKQERWIQVMSSFYGMFCKKHKTKAVKAQINARILLEHPDYRTSDFKNGTAGFLQKVPAAEINEARKRTYEICAK